MNIYSQAAVDPIFNVTVGLLPSWPGLLHLDGTNWVTSRLHLAHMAALHIYVHLQQMQDRPCLYWPLFKWNIEIFTKILRLKHEIVLCQTENTLLIRDGGVVF